LAGEWPAGMAMTSWRIDPSFWEKDTADGSMIKRAIGFVIYFAEENII